MSRPHFDALFVDRDGTLIVERGFLGDPRGVRLSKGAAERLKRFTDVGTKLFLVTNQSGIARGVVTWDQVNAVNAEVVRRLARRGVPVAGVLVCPHHPEGKVAKYRKRCRCRKPRTALHERAIREHGLDAVRTVVIGDKWDDVGAAASLGCAAAHVATGYGREHRARVRALSPDAILARTLADALERLEALAPRPRR